MIAESVRNRVYPSLAHDGPCELESDNQIMPKKLKKTPVSSATRISATEAARNFSELLNRVLYRRHAYLVQRGSTTVCEIRPAYDASGFKGADLARLLASLPDAPAAYLDAVEEGIRSQPEAQETTWRR